MLERKINMPTYDDFFHETGRSREKAFRVIPETEGILILDDNAK